MPLAPGCASAWYTLFFRGNSLYPGSLIPSLLG